MSFFSHEEIYPSDERNDRNGEQPSSRSRLIVPICLRLAIPRRLALQQGPPPLHQPATP
jgi:hypothetical protein